MRDLFPGYFPLPAEKVASMWDEALIVLDSSALLNSFRYSAATRSDFLKLLADKQEQLWIPNQVAKEFLENSDTVIKAERDALKKVADVVEAAHAEITKVLSDHKRFGTVPHAELFQLATSMNRELKGVLERGRAEHAESTSVSGAYAKTLEQIVDLYEARVGEAWAADRLSELYKEGAKRFEEQIPPGYKDVRKGNPEQYGDLVIWKQIIEKSKADERDIIFVTDDGKEDWFRIVNGERRGARVELIREFVDATGRSVKFYLPDRFLENAKMHGGTIADTSVEEAVEVTKRRSTRVGVGQRWGWGQDVLAGMERVEAELSPERRRAIEALYNLERPFGIGGDRRSARDTLAERYGTRLAAGELEQLLNSPGVQGPARNEALWRFIRDSESRQKHLNDAALDLAASDAALTAAEDDAASLEESAIAENWGGEGVIDEGKSEDDRR